MLIRCGTCGVPRIVSLLMRWNSNGTMSNVFDPNFKTIIIESDFLSDLFGIIEKKMGLPIGHIVFEAERNAAGIVIGGAVDRFKLVGNIARKFFITRKITVSVFCMLAVWLGQCHARAVRYESGAGGEAGVRNPFNRDLMAAIIVGAFEALERVPFKHRWFEGEEEDMVSISPESERPEISRRLFIDYKESATGNWKPRRCPKCNAPWEVRHLAWLETEGIIFDTKRTVRVTLLDSYTPSVVLRELAHELGDEIVYELAIEAQKESSLKYMEELTGFSQSEVERSDNRDELVEQAYGNFMEILPLRGQGLPTGFKRNADNITISVDNPFSIHLLAGQMLAIYEFIEGRSADIVWQEPSVNSVVYTLKPK